MACGHMWAGPQEDTCRALEARQADTPTGTRRGGTSAHVEVEVGRPPCSTTVKRGSVASEGRALLGKRRGIGPHCRVCVVVCIMRVGAGAIEFGGGGERPSCHEYRTSMRQSTSRVRREPLMQASEAG
jgi:hypothetical protein